MIKDSSKHLFEMIIVWKLDRFARNRYDSARYKSLLKKNGVKVVSATEVISDGAEGIILESVLSVKKKRAVCKKKPVKKDWLEDLVVNETMKIVMDDKAIEAIVSMVMNLQDRENTNLPLYEQQLQEANTSIQNMLNAIQMGILTPSVHHFKQIIYRRFKAFGIFDSGIIL